MPVHHHSEGALIEDAFAVSAYLKERFRTTQGIVRWQHMGFLKSSYRALLLTISLALCGTGCFKEEYSYEGGPLPDDTLLPGLPAPPDTVIRNGGAFINAACSTCGGQATDSAYTWQFRCDTLAFCGPVTNAVLSPDQTAFTFFGPSACVPGTGLIVTAYFDSAAFTQNRTNISAVRAHMQYYDNNNGRDLLGRDPSGRFSVTVHQFDRQSRVATGRFGGTVLTAEGSRIPVDSGLFRIRFK